ncbi:sugar ABC transporter permease [Polyangium jinanense]|uniref:Maltose/maltodextrin transport system permease protein MalG n=1 Tax=Polyangium jinanense TaxID=2829994 RepID=A0A9X3X1P2_9BACT|nr:sugar ABC transporter permease [Polyangium jinanense]MDC3953061.1 sugar ABC transporter permease [Polyangium jinanense]MDC3979826.1 sugar ABC transporter permease [Polyangium jinanense]
MNKKPPFLESAACHVVLVIAVAFALYPVLWVVALAFSGTQTPSPRVIPVPEAPTLAHLSAVVGATRKVDGVETWLFGRQLANSLVVSLATTLVGVLIAIPTAYALARFRFAGKESGVRALLATQMFPAVASAIPLYMILNYLGLLNSRTGLVVCYASTSVPFSIFQLRAAFEAIPVDLEEAAMVDGATRFSAFVRVVLPAARPAIAVTALFAFMGAYNEFILAATLLDKEEMFTLPVMLQRFIGEYDAQWEKFAAGALVVSLPVMALFYVAQRHLVAGLTAGGVKG